MSDPVLALGLGAFALLLVALPLSFWSVSSGGQGSRVVRLLVAAANLALTAQLVLRWWQSGHFPISNLYESLCFLAWASTLTQLLVERSYPSPVVAAAATPMALGGVAFASFALPDQLQQAAPLVPAASSPMALGCVAFASFALPDRLQEASPLVPALRSSWLVMHVSVIMVSYAALLVGSLLSLAVLVTDRGQQLELRSSSIGSGGFRQAELAAVATGGSGFNFSSGSLSLSEQLDSLSYRTITVGFLLLSVGIVSGAVWANEAWGSWWSWDPKETWALICWLVYAAYLHTRLSRGWQGRRPALVAVAGFVVICVCYIGVNLLGIGLHSYGWFLSA